MKNHKGIALSLANKAGHIMRQNFKLGMHKNWKEDNSPVTETDIAINNLVISEIRKNFPSHGILGEESSYFNGEKYVWVCDPVDGTNPFSRGYPTFTFSLALTEQGVPILGLLYDAILNRILVAESGRGAFLNEKRVTVSGVESLSRAAIALECNNPKLDKARRYLWEHGCLMTAFACVTYSSLLVAIGEFSAVVWEGKTPWDGAAVQVVIEEAGGICTSVKGLKQRYDREIDGLVAGNKNIHAELIRLLN